MRSISRPRLMACENETVLAQNCCRPRRQAAPAIFAKPKLVMIGGEFGG
jgi:hypothetical protein